MMNAARNILYCFIMALLYFLLLFYYYTIFLKRVITHKYNKLVKSAASIVKLIALNTLHAIIKENLK